VAQTFPKSSISTEAAHQAIAAAEAKASEMGTPMVIAVVDDGGVLKAFSRMDGAALLSVQVAQDKAYTAVGFGMPTHGWHDFIKDDPPLADGAPTGIDRLVIFGGGYPITVDGQVVGAIGVSGGHYSEDQQVAEAGLQGSGAPAGEGGAPLRGRAPAPTIRRLGLGLRLHRRQHRVRERDVGA